MVYVFNSEVTLKEYLPKESVGFLFASSEKYEVCLGFNGITTTSLSGPASLCNSGGVNSH